VCRNVPTHPQEDLRIVNAGLFHSVDGVVESPDLPWENARLITGDLFDFVGELKQADGGDISICGSISLVRQLLLEGCWMSWCSSRIQSWPAVAGGSCSSRTARQLDSA
jgi:hypothetical protein